MSESTYIIAEAGVNHNGDMALAKRLVEVAAQAGADAVKFQTFQADKLSTHSAPKAAYQREAGEVGESQHAMLKKLELNREDHLELIAYCAEQGIEFLSTGFDTDSLDMLNELGVSRFKIPSGEITNLPYLRHVAALGKPLILSTGMSDLGDIEAALAVLTQAGCALTQIHVLHCTTAYPTPAAEVNLRAMNTVAQAFGVAVGYSDHTLGTEVSIAAVALGARVIEKHFTLDRTLPGPDHKASLEPQELKALVSAVRNVERCLGEGTKRPSESELPNRIVARRSIVAAVPIRAGELFCAENLSAKRPGSGIPPMRWDDIIGRRAVRDFQADELIEI